MSDTASSLEQASPEHVARDRFVDGLLRTQHERPIDRERRVQRAMQGVRAHEQSTGFAAGLRRHAGSLAAVAAVIAAAFLFTPSQVSAADRARATAQGERAVRDRRVMFLLNPPDFAADRPTLTGTLDVRDERHMVLTLHRPDGSEVVHGLDGDHAWCIEASGEVHDEPADHPWPVWIRSPRGGLIVDIAESMESGLSPGWQWNVSKAEAGADQLVAVREAGPRAEPNRIVASIDSMSGRVKRLQIEWPKGGAPTPFERVGEMAGDHPPPPRGDKSARHPPPPRGEGGESPIERARPGANRPGDGPMPPRGGRSGEPLGAPGSMVIMPEPPVTFPDDWFSAARHAPKATP